MKSLIAPLPSVVRSRVGVVEDDEHAVLGGLDVGLDVAVAQVDGRLEGRHRVLQGRAVAEPAAAMRERQRQPVVVEVRVLARRAGHRSQREYDGRSESVDMRHTDEVPGMTRADVLMSGSWTP